MRVILTKFPPLPLSEDVKMPNTCAGNDEIFGHPRFREPTYLTVFSEPTLLTVAVRASSTDVVTRCSAITRCATSHTKGAIWASCAENKLYHWTQNIFIPTKFSQLAPEVVKITTPDADDNENLIQSTCPFRCAPKPYTDDIFYSASVSTNYSTHMLQCKLVRREYRHFGEISFSGHIGSCQNSGSATDVSSTEHSGWLGF